MNTRTRQWIKEKPTAERVTIHWIFFDMIYLSSQHERYVEGYKKELYKKKMKISSWRLLEPSKWKLEVQFRKGKLSIQVDRGDPVRPVGR